MSVSLFNDFSKTAAAKLTVLALSVAVFGGCATGMPGTPSTPNNQLADHTYTDVQGIIRYNGTLEPVLGVESSCTMLSDEVREQGKESSEVETSLSRLGNGIADPYKGKPADRWWATHILVGTIGAGANIIGEAGRSAGSYADAKIKEKRLGILARHCEQNRAHTAWEQAQAKCTIRVNDQGGTSFSGTARSTTNGRTQVDQDCVQSITERYIMRGQALPEIPQSPLNFGN